MSSNLSKKHLAALKWLSKGNKFQVCTSFGRCLGKVSAVGEHPSLNLKSSMDQLFSQNYIVLTESKIYGLRWCSCHISEKGMRVLASEVNEL